MPTIQIDIPVTADLNLAVDAVCWKYGYKATVNGGTANPETKNQFAKRMLANWIKSAIADYNSDIAASSARTNANALNIT